MTQVWYSIRTPLTSSVDFQLCINNATLFPRQHDRGASRMILCIRIASKPSVDLVVGLNGWSRRNLSADCCAQRGSASDTTGDLEPLAKYNAI